MKSRFALFLAAGCVLAACKKELEPQESSSVSDTTAAVASTDPAAEALVNAPSQNMTTVQQTVQPSQVQPQQQTAKGMNPPHGQPGHRCDIPVGAPLNSAPANKPAAQGQTFTVNPTSQTQNAPPATLAAPAVETPPGMNPPHGQPGHVCSVPVGQPLPKADGTPGGGETQE